jgi:RNA-binding protein YlmH
MNGAGADPPIAAARLAELACRAAERRSVEFTRFLDPREQRIAARAAEEAGAHAAFSGAQNVERRLCAFDGRLWLDDSARRYDWPALPLEILWDGRFAAAAHRDILGAVLALGIGRESIGDILVGDGRAVCWALESAAGFIAGNLRSAGRAQVKAQVIAGDATEALGASVLQAKGSVHSLRLDAVVAEAFDLSREEAARAVKSGLVKLDWAEETKGDRKVGEGSLISVRGMGRVRIVKASDKTRRSGRTIVEFERTV